ncbi:LysR substrate-binding domain-containing protein [Achromobacter sp. DH1f]|uniref:LysR substrate-binding domain-containing protein n=1 Tax=Achromobacter sp. DH1f TaxID=1397275 RepID=UPI000467F87B|nr:LysR substrate-binding domain-containing protein [Achromobacter sp. DH1f]
MTNLDTVAQANLIRRLPSMKALLFFNVVGRHLNLVRAGQELHLTQGALSRQVKMLEQHLGVELFRRLPRGLAFTQEGETLYAYSQQAFDTLNAGLRRLSLVAGRQTLVVSVARSFALRVLASRLPRFLQAYPWVDVQIDTHRYFADLETSGADVSIRLTDGHFDSGYRQQRLTDDASWAVASPAVARRMKARQSQGARFKPVLLSNSERDDWNRWLDAGNPSIPLDEATLKFNDSAPMLQAVETGLGFCVARAALVRDAIEAGTLIRVWKQDIHDGLCYRAISAPRDKPALEPFLQWLDEEFVAARP